MFVIFGWGKKSVNNFGAAVPAICPNCHNDGFLNLLHKKTWFSLFFIPVLPYDSNYYLLCEICSAGLELYGADVNKAKQMNAVTRSFIDGSIDKDRYLESIESIQLIKLLVGDDKRNNS